MARLTKQTDMSEADRRTLDRLTLKGLAALRDRQPVKEAA